MWGLALALALQAAPTSAWERFPVFVWTQSARPVELVRELGGACVQRTADASWLDERGLDWFVFNAPGRDDLHLDRDNARYQERWKRWYDTRDPKLLVREPCLASPATRERLERLLDESLAARGGRTGSGVSLGDEIGLTPGGVPEDVCQCEHCERAWSSFRAARGFEQDLKLADIATDATLRAVTKGETSALGPWLLRREFHQQQTLDVIEALAQRVRAKSPGTPVGLLGLTAQSAFGSVSVERLLPLLDFVECYRVGNARELAFTLRKPEQRVLLTVFLDERGPDFTAWQAWEHWLRGGDGLVVWSEADLKKSPAHRERLARAVRDIRAVQQIVGRFRPVPRGVAVVHSQPSVAASWVRDAQEDGSTWPKRFPSYQEEHGALELARRRWFELSEDCGAMPGALPLARVGADTAKRFRVLVLDDLLVLDDDDIERLKSFVAAGGALCVHGQLGWVDSSGSKSARHRRDRLPPASVAPHEFDGRTTGVELRDAASAWFRGLGVERAPFEVEGTAGARWCWISAWMPSSDGLLCAALPKPLPSTAGKVALAFPGEIRVAAAAAWRIEWLHPTPDEQGMVTLPAGDAAVFRLLPCAK